MGTGILPLMEHDVLTHGRLLWDGWTCCRIYGVATVELDSGLLVVSFDLFH